MFHMLAHDQILHILDERKIEKDFKKTKLGKTKVALPIFKVNEEIKKSVNFLTLFLLFLMGVIQIKRYKAWQRRDKDVTKTWQRRDKDVAKTWTRRDVMRIN